MHLKLDVIWRKTDFYQIVYDCCNQGVHLTATGTTPVHCSLTCLPIYWIDRLFCLTSSF
jgi:hypothetical protein